MGGVPPPRYTSIVMDDELKQYFENLNERVDNLSERTAAEFRQMREENADFRQGTATEFQRIAG